MKNLLLISVLTLLNGESDTKTSFITETNINSFVDKFYFNRVEDNGQIHNYYGFIELNIDNFIRIKYNDTDLFYLIDSYHIDDDNVYHINDDILFDVSNRVITIGDKSFYINSTINSRY